MRGLPRIDWKISDLERRSVAELATAFSREMIRTGRLAPELPQWLVDGDLKAIPFSDMAHPIGTTRMAVSPKMGVVDPDCMVHGVEGLFVTGTSVFPSASHVNPTLMVAALSLRLADKLKSQSLKDSASDPTITRPAILATSTSNGARSGPRDRKLVTAVRETSGSRILSD